MAPSIRRAQPSDYGRVIQHVNAWWEGREIEPVLPKLFFVHFEGTSLVAETDDGALVGFLVGFLSQTHDDEAYVHFVGVSPEYRGRGLGRSLYEAFFSTAKEHGRAVVRCVAAPEDVDSVAFHEALGFHAGGVVEDYDGQGKARVILTKRL